MTLQASRVFEYPEDHFERRERKELGKVITVEVNASELAEALDGTSGLPPSVTLVRQGENRSYPMAIPLVRVGVWNLMRIMPEGNLFAFMENKPGTPSMPVRFPQIPAPTGGKVILQLQEITNTEYFNSEDMDSLMAVTGLLTGAREMALKQAPAEPTPAALRAEDLHAANRNLHFVGVLAATAVAATLALSQCESPKSAKPAQAPASAPQSTER